MTMTFQDARERVRADDAGKWDTLVPRDELALENGRLIRPRLSRPDGSPPGWTPTPWAVGQFCHRLSIPTAYFRRCPPALQDAQFNYWVAAGRNGTAPRRTSPRRERWLLRTHGEALRGVLTERYVCLDHTDLLAALAPLIEERFEVTWFALTSESLHLRLVDPTRPREVLPDDPIVAGLHLANSEVGSRAVTLDALVWRLVCTNGLVRLVRGRSLLYQRHVALSQARFTAALGTAVQEALQQSADFIEQVSQTTRQPLPDLDGTLRGLAARWRLTQSTQKHLRQALLREPPGQQETLYGLINAVTQAAQWLPADERYRLEALAGQLVERGLGRLDRPALTLGPSAFPSWEGDPEEPPPEREEPPAEREEPRTDD
jgi:hypothetical protein